MSQIRPKHELRVTKYYPANRAADGHYLGDEWYCFSQVGQGKVSIRDCVKVEDRYIAAAMALLRDDGCKHLTAIDSGDPESPRRDLNLEDLPERLRLCLREQSRERFEAEDRFVRVGWDYYMYVGVNSINDDTVAGIESSGLFIEPFPSPYFEEDSEA